MSRNLIILIVGVLAIPASILGGSIAVESGRTPQDCTRRGAWLRDSTAIFAAAEGAAGDSGGRYAASESRLRTVAAAYDAAVVAQKASNPPASDAASNELVTQYFQWMSENWIGWIAHPYQSIHSDLALKAQATSLHNALLASKDHCA